MQVAYVQCVCIRLCGSYCPGVAPSSPQQLLQQQRERQMRHRGSCRERWPITEPCYQTFSQSPLAAPLAPAGPCADRLQLHKPAIAKLSVDLQRSLSLRKPNAHRNAARQERQQTSCISAAAAVLCAKGPSCSAHRSHALNESHILNDADTAVHFSCLCSLQLVSQPMQLLRSP